MSSEVETFLILIRFLKQRLNWLIPRFPCPCPRGFAVHVNRPLRFIRRLRRAPLGMTITQFSAFALASLRQDRLGFPEENATVAGRRRHTLRLSAFADK